MWSIKWKVVRTFAQENFWVHTGIGVTGNSCFFVATVLWKVGSAMDLAIWLFIFGSAMMLVGSIGTAFARWERDIYRRKQEVREQQRQAEPY